MRALRDRLEMLTTCMLSLVIIASGGFGWFEPV